MPSPILVASRLWRSSELLTDRAELVIPGAVTVPVTGQVRVRVQVHAALLSLDLVEDFVEREPLLGRRVEAREHVFATAGIRHRGCFPSFAAARSAVVSAASRLAGSSLQRGQPALRAHSVRSRSRSAGSRWGVITTQQAGGITPWVTAPDSSSAPGPAASGGGGRRRAAVGLRGLGHAASVGPWTGSASNARAGL